MYNVMFHHSGDNAKYASIVAICNNIGLARKELSLRKQKYINHGYTVKKDDHIKDRINVYSSYTGKYRLSVYIERDK